MKNKLLILLPSLFLSVIVNAQKSKTYSVASPNGAIHINIDAASKLTWSVTQQSQVIIEPSAIAMHLNDGKVLGENAQIISAKKENVNTTIAALFYKKDTIEDNYTQLTLNCKNDYGIIFRAYNDAAAYRFFTKKKDSIIVQNEEANFRITLKSTQVEQCFDVLMAPQVASDCSSTAQIITYQNADCE